MLSPPGPHAAAAAQSIAIPHFRRWVSTAVLLSCAVALPPDRVRAQTAPAKPTGFTTEDGNAQVRLRWTGPDDLTITGWRYTYRLEPFSSAETATFGPWTAIPGSGPATRRHTVTGLTNNRTYTFKLQAVNSTGPGRESVEKTGNPYPVTPAEPTGFRAVPGDRKAVLVWNDADDASIQGWEYRQKESGGAYGSWLAIPGSGASTTTHTVTGLENGTEYVFRIQAYNGSGTGYGSAERSVTPMPAVPEKPTGFSVEAGNRKAVLTWDDPGNGTIVKWQYAYKTTGGYGGWTDMPGSGAGTVRHVVSMLGNDTAHTFKIRAVNDVGEGAESDEVAATPMAEAPEKPAGFAALAGDAQIALSWTDPSDASISKWQYAFRTSGDYGEWTDIPGSGAATTAHTVVELVNGTTYVFRIRAVNDVGNGPESDEASATPLSAPAQPTGFSVEAGDARVTLGWNDPLNSAISGWQYSFRTSAGYGAWADIAGSGANTTGHTVADLSNGVEYTFRIRAVAGGSYGAESVGIAATPRPVPAKPAGLRAEAGNTQARLAWTDPGNSSISGWQYSFRTAEDHGAWLDIPGSGAATVRHTVTQLANGTSYAFRIRALNGSGAGPGSDEASATPRIAAPGKPTGFRVEAGDGEVVLKWDDPDDSSIEGWQYKAKEAGGSYAAEWDNIPGSGARTVLHVVTGLENGTTYVFKLRAVNSANGYESDERSATPRSLRPAAPTGLTAEAGDGRVALTWDDPGDATITGWQYAVRTTGAFGAWTGIPGSTAATTRYTAVGLENGMRHGFKLRAVNGHGNGAESGEAAATPVAVPLKPTGLRATPGDGQVRLDWDDPNDPTVAGWQYSIATTGAHGGWTDIPGSDAGTTGHAITELDNGTAYRFRVRAVNASGFGAESDEAAATPVAVPAGPTGLTAVPGDGRVTLEWDDPGDATITGWQYSIATTGAHGGWVDIPGSDAATTGHAIAELDNGTAYRFRVRAVNASGFGAESDEAAATPVAVPAGPAGLTATPGDGRVTLEWDNPGNGTITGWQYDIAASGAYGGWTGIPGSTVETTGHTVTELDNGTAYRFRVRAVNASGFGAESDEAAATPVAVPAGPAGLTAVPGDGRVALEWDDPGDATITGWQYSIATTGVHGGWVDITGSDAGTTGHAVAELDNGTAYRFRVRAVNASGFGAESDEVAAVPFAAPAKPTGLTATPGAGQVLLEWDDPNDPAITGWEYNLRLAGGAFEEDWTFILQSGAPTANCIVVGLETGSSYGFKVRAVAGDRTGAESDEAAVTLPTVPAKPAGLAATAGDGRVLLEWTAPGDLSVTLWQYRYRTIGGYGRWIDISGSGAATVSHSVTGLDSGVLHTFRIRAVNSSGHGVESGEVAAIPFSVPSRPTGVRATPGDGLVLLEWDGPDDPEITGWDYNQRRADGAFEEEWTFVPRSGAARTSYVVIGLENGVSYSFKLRAVAGDRIGPESEEATARPVAGLPAPPQRLRATAGDGHAALLWDDPANPVITGWQYRYRTTGDYTGWIDIPGSGPSLTGHTVTGLANGVVHYFQVRAGTVSGFGPPSETASISPEPSKPGTPTGFRALPGDGQVVLAWDAAPDPTLHWEYVRWIDDAGACADGTGDWVDAGRADATGHTVTGLENDIAYCFRVRTARADASGNTLAASEASNPVSATPRAVAKPVERKTVKAVMAGLAGRMAAGAEAAIGTRFSADPSASRVVLAGREVPLFASVRERGAPYRRGSEARGRVMGMEGRDLLRGSAFQFPFGPPDADGALQGSLWHRGDMRVFQGSAGPQSRYGGRLLSAWFGMDMRWDEQWLAGAALAHSKGEMEYAAGAVSGVLKTSLDSVHPYVQRRFEDGGTAWAMFGHGRGTIENAAAGQGVQTADSETAAVSAGFRSPLPALGGLKLSASGAAGFARLETGDGGRTALGSLSASADRQSLGLEGALEEGEASRRMSVSLRRDGGDGVTGMGLELAGGFRSPLPASSGHVDIRARWLARHSEREYREFGLTVTVRQPAGANRRGPSWSLAAAHGSQVGASGEPGALWSDDMEERGSANTAPALDMRAGWGFASRGAALTPHASLGLAGAQSGRVALGLDMGPRSGPTLKLAAERRILRTGAPQSRITAALEFRF